VTAKDFPLIILH